jgi:hypothetical protein
MTKSTIPGNNYSEIRIYADTTKEYLEDRLAKVVGAQKANQRNNLRYVKHVRELRNAIAAR